MYFVLSVVLPLLISSFGECASVNNTYNGTISVNNGPTSRGLWGTWGKRDLCPPGTYATGFSLKVEGNQGFWRDDTALNGIALQCSKPITSAGRVGPFTTITSSVGSWGSWTSNIWCSRGALKAFQLRVEGFQGPADDTAANNIRFICTGGQVLEGSGMSWGNWGYWSPVCGGTGICGIQTQVESPQGILDDTSLNDVILTCCY